MGLNLNNDELIFTINGSVTYVDDMPIQTNGEEITIYGEAQPSAQGGNAKYATPDGNVAVKVYTLFIDLSEDLNKLAKADKVNVRGEDWSILGYYPKQIGAHEIYIGTKK